MVKVKATDAYVNNKANKGERLVISDSELGRVPKEGEIFEVTEARYEVLSGNNLYGLVFVEKVEENEEISQKQEEKIEKKTTKKKTAKKK